MAKEDKPNAQALLGLDDDGNPNVIHLNASELWKECVSPEDCKELAGIFMPATRLWTTIGMMVTAKGISIQIADTWYRPGWDRLAVAGIEMGTRSIKFRPAPQNSITFRADLDEKILKIHLLTSARESEKSEHMDTAAMRALGIPFALEDIMDNLAVNTQIIGIFHEKCLRWETMWEDPHIPGIRKMVWKLKDQQSKTHLKMKVPDNSISDVIHQVSNIGPSLKV